MSIHPFDVPMSNSTGDMERKGILKYVRSGVNSAVKREK